MSDIAIRVENLSKAYRIAHERGRDRYKTLREDLFEIPKRILFRFTSNRDAAPQSEDFWALNDVSFEVQEGEVMGIIGRNGAGKSTLLKILSRITSPTKGCVNVYGRVGSLLEVGTGFHPELTGRENIYLNGTILGMRRDEISRKFDEIVAFAEVEKFLDTPVKRYSSGMYVRLAFAVAAHLEPEILIIDEVLAVGDAQFQKKCLGKMEEIATRGRRTVIFVSHNLEAIQNLCPRSLYLHRGKVRGIGSSIEITKQYLHEAREQNVGWLQQRLNTSKPVSIVGFQVLNKLDQPYIVTGEDCYFELEVQAKSHMTPLRVAFGIDDKYGRRLFTLDSSRFGVSYDAISGCNRFRCQVESLPLKPDTYYAHLFIGNAYEAYDYVNGEAEFAVNSPQSDSTIRIDESHGSIVVGQHWLK